MHWFLFVMKVGNYFSKCYFYLVLFEKKIETERSTLKEFRKVKMIMSMKTLNFIDKANIRRCYVISKNKKHLK